MPSNRSSDTHTGHRSYADIGRSSAGAVLSYSDVDGDLLRRAVDRVATEGDAIVLGRTSDAGAFSVRVLADKMVHKWYPADLEELHSVLQGLAE